MRWVSVTAVITAETFATVDRAVRTHTDAALGVPSEVSTTLRSDAYAMPEQEKRRKPERLRFESSDELRRHATLVTGTWPAPGSEPIEAAISQSTASLTGLTAGQVVSTQGRINLEPVRVKITGVYVLDDPYGSHWANDQLLSTGVEWGWYTTFGPLMVERDAALPGVTAAAPGFHGQVATVPLEREPVQIKVAGIVTSMPGTPQERPGLLMDWQTMQARNLAAGRVPLPATDWWLATGDADTALAALKRDADVTAVGRQDLTAPLSGTLRAALMLGLLAALAHLLVGVRRIRGRRA